MYRPFLNFCIYYTTSRAECQGVLKIYFEKLLV
nr:MAG TPA: hypothetical protein [Caudoviricetes sp.]